MDPDHHSELLKQALDCLRVPDDCREDATAWTLDVARVFRERHAIAQQSAPRLADMKDQTGAMEKHARELARLLGESDPYFIWAATGYLGVDEWSAPLDPPPVRKTEKPAEAVQDIPYFSEIMDPQKRTQLTRRLQRLANLAKHLHEALPQDTGGRHNLRNIFEAPPRWSLAVDCWELFDWFRPGEATGHVDPAPTSRKGGYHIFVETVYELALAEKPNSGLTTFTKRAAPRCNAYAEGRPAYRHLRQASAPGTSPVGILTGTGLAADFYNVPSRLLDEITGRKQRR